MKTQYEHDDFKLREDAVVWRTLDDQTVLLALDSSTYLQLNATGTLLWPMLVEGTTPAALIAALVAHFDVDADRAAADVDAFLDGCRRQRLLA